MSDGPVDLGAVGRLYSDSLAEHGTVPRGVGWRGDTDHLLRFEKLTYVINSGVPSLTVNDLGCGYGALYEYLAQRFDARKYRGYDISTEMLAEARRRLPAETGIELVEGAQLDKLADYSFASGIFNVRLGIPEAAWRKHVLDTLVNMFEHSTRGFSFNLLSTNVDYQEDHLFYGDPMEFFEYCRKEFSPRISLLHDYPLFEWTMIVRL